MKIDDEKLEELRHFSSLQMRLHASAALTKVLLQLHFSANQTTYLSIIFGLVGVYLMYFGPMLLAIPAIYIYIVLDYSDGWIARYNGTVSKFGYDLDHANHTIIIVLMLIVSSLISGQYLAGASTIAFFLISIIRPYQEEGLLGGTYSKIKKVGVQLLPELGIYLGVILNRLEILIFSHLLLYGTVFVLLVFVNARKLKKKKREVI